MADFDAGDRQDRRNGETPLINRQNVQVPTSSDSRVRVLQRLAGQIVATKRPHPTRVAIDGRSAAGKSTVAEELAVLISPSRPVIVASVDDFHGLWIDRSNRRQLTAESFYLNGYDYPKLRSLLLTPLGPGGSRRYQTRWHDGWNQGPIDEPMQVAPVDAVLIMEGAFLFRPELNDNWDLRILIDIDAAQSISRGVERDLASAASDSAELRTQRERVYIQRYVPAEELYLATVNPAALADLVIDNRDLESPRIIGG